MKQIARNSIDLFLVVFFMRKELGKDPPKWEALTGCVVTGEA